MKYIHFLFPVSLILISFYFSIPSLFHIKDIAVIYGGDFDLQKKILVKNYYDGKISISKGYDKKEKYAEIFLKNCTVEDYKYAMSWSYYDPESSYAFGLQIKEAIRERDLVKLMSLTTKYTSGPRKRYTEGKNFSDIFSEEWRQNILKADIPCGPVGWRNFSINKGAIWYTGSHADEDSSIVTLNFYNREQFKRYPKGWVNNNSTLSPRCFPFRWLWSDDNWELFIDQYNISEDQQDNFYENPGQYFGREVFSYEPLASPWEARLSSKKIIKLAQNLQECLTYKRFSIENNYIDFKREYSSIDDFLTYEISYNVLSKVKTEHCHILAPNVKGKCKEAYLINIGDWGGGSMGFQWSVYIYGIFEMENNNSYILPLKYFGTENIARNYLDNYNEK